MGLPIRSPYPIRKPDKANQSVATGIADLLAINKVLEDVKAFKATLQREHDAKMQRMDAAIADAEEAIQRASLIKQGIQGPQGPKGDSIVGPQGPQGEKGDTPEVDHEAIARIAATYVPAPKDGKDATPDDVVTHILDNKLLKIDHIHGLREEMGAVRNAAMTQMRGGGDTVRAGTGISITQSNGVKIISASGSAALTPISLTGAIDDSNVTFTAASQPTFLIINGAIYQQTGGAYTWSYAAGTITLSSPVGTGGSIYGL